MGWIDNIFKSKAEIQKEEEERAKWKQDRYDVISALNRAIDTLDKEIRDGKVDDVYPAFKKFADSDAVSSYADWIRWSHELPDDLCQLSNKIHDRFCNGAHVVAEEQCGDYADTMKKCDFIYRYRKDSEYAGFMSGYITLAQRTPIEQRTKLFDSLHSSGVLETAASKWVAAKEISCFLLHAFEGMDDREIYHTLHNTHPSFLTDSSSKFGTQLLREIRDSELARQHSYTSKALVSAMFPNQSAYPSPSR